MAGGGIDARDLRFDGRRVLVTGAGGGLGSEMARAFHAHGGQVVLADRDRERMEDVAAELGGAERLAYDQADPASVEGLAASAGAVDVLLNNAGIAHTGPLLDMDPAALVRLVATNLTGPMLLARAVARGMAARGADRAVYGTTKAGIVQFTRAAAAELAPRGVRVVALAPGRTLTPLTASALADPDYMAESLAHIPAGRLGRAEEMARFALFLASPAAEYVVGETLVADGGYVLR